MSSGRTKQTAKRKRTAGTSSPPPDDASYFSSSEQVVRYLQIKDRKIEPLRCLSEKLYQSTHLPALFAKYKLEKFLCFKSNAFPRLVRMFYSNLGIADDKVSCYLLEKQIVVDCGILADLYDMDASAPKLSAGSFPSYSKDEAIRLLFPFSTPRDASGKLLITGLSPEDRILHYVLCKVLIPRATNFTQIVEDELFLMWVIKNQLDFNMPYFIIKYLAECSKRSDIGFLPYGMLLTPIFEKVNLNPKAELQVSLINSTTMITASHLHKMHLVQDEQGKWQKKRGPNPTLSAGASSSGGATSVDHSVVIEEVRGLHTHLMDQFTTLITMHKDLHERMDHFSAEQQEIKASIAALNDRFNGLESQVSVIDARLQEREEADELQNVDFDPPAE